MDSKEETIEYNFREMMIEEQNTCCLCGGDLIFKHDVDYSTLTVHEEADCPGCKIRLKTKTFGLN